MGLAVIIPGADYSAVNIGTVTPVDVIELVSLAIVGPSTVDYQAQFSAAYTPADTTQTRVGWSVDSGSEYATIDANGLLTTKTGASSNSVTIRVYSVYDPQIYATKTVTVTHHKTLDYTALLQTNQAEYNVGALNTNPIDGKSYPYFKTNTTGIIGNDVTAGWSQTAGNYQIFKINVKDFARVKMPVLNSSSGMGYAFTDGQNKVVAVYLNTTISTGSYDTVSVPAGTTYLFLVLSKSIYDVVTTTMYVELLDAV